MISCRPRENTRRERTLILACKALIGLMFSCGFFFSPFHGPAVAVVTNTPWTPEASYQNLIVGTSSGVDVIRVVGAQPDEIVYGQQMFPVLENYYYFDKSGAATIFVLENGILAGLHYKSPDNQMIDVTYCLPNNGDLNRYWPAAWGGYQPYYTNFNLFYGSMQE